MSEETKETPQGDGLLRVLVEMRIPKQSGVKSMMMRIHSLALPDFTIDNAFEAIPIKSNSAFRADEDVVVVRGTLQESCIKKLESQPNVIKVWRDTKIAPFQTDTQMKLIMANAICPIPPCDCDPGTAKGDLNSVARFLGVDKIWNQGFKGKGVVIGIVDGGISAKGRTQEGVIPNVTNGCPENWGTVAYWDEHGNMTATDALGMAPEANIYDLRIANDAISDALSAFQWAINQYKMNGTPHILSNSWGIYQREWDPEYASNPNHPFTRKVVEAVNEGIIVLFAAGNCGAVCPSERCGQDVGPEKDIWGANGLHSVITVGAVNQNSQYIGYSSAGPSAFDDTKPDICGVSHFRGYFSSDTGTSAACPIVAGVVALLKQAKKSLANDDVLNLLQTTANQIGSLSNGWNQYSGYGVIDAKKAFDKLKGEPGEYKLKARVTANSLNVRSGPGLEYQVIDTLYSGDIVTILYLEINLSDRDIWIEFETGKWSALAYRGKQYMNIEPRNDLKACG